MEPIGWVHTPNDWDELMEWIDQHAKADRPHLLTAALMAYNLACKYHKENEHAHTIHTQEKTKGDTSEP